MQDTPAATSPEEAAMLDAFAGGSPVPVGNDDAAEAAQELADAASRAANPSTESYAPGRGTRGLYR